MAVKRLWFYIKLYPYFVSRSVQSRMSYKSDFILGVTASALMQALGYVFIWAVFQGIPEMNGWSFYQMVFVYGMSAISLGLNEFLFAGSWQVGKYVRDGSFDRLLLRPVGTMFSILAAQSAACTMPRYRPPTRTAPSQAHAGPHPPPRISASRYARKSP